MKLANKLSEMLQDREQAEAGDTSTNENHWHKTEIDIDGNGKTIQTLPADHLDHQHVITNNIALPVIEDGHTHTVVA